ncbi:MAG: hypothetical protein OEY86_12095 [Nitrospira sp.]|nr:hypothetical protein [Nitrospira sp.]
MIKFILTLLLMAGSFAGGYYLAQQPDGTVQATVSKLSKEVSRSEKLVGDVRQSIQTLSQSAFDTTVGIERDLRRRQGLVEAKSRLIQAKSNVLDRNFSDAARELAEAITVLESSAKDISRDPETDAVLDLARSLRETRLEVAMGKPVPMKKMDDLQREFDRLLNK